MARTTTRRGTETPHQLPAIEHELSNTYNVLWEFRDSIPLREFDEAKSLKNQARFNPLDEEVVEQYAEAVTRGDIFPAVIAYRPGKTPRAKLVMIDGNHRYAAHKKAGVPIAVYIVNPDTDPNTIARMTFAFNTRHGKAISEAERVHHAMYLMDSGASLNDAASALSLPVGKLRSEFSKRNANIRAIEAGISPRVWDALNQTIRTRLNNIKTDEGMRAAAELAQKARLKVDQVGALVVKANDSQGGAKQVKIIKDLERSTYGTQIQQSAGGLLGGAGTNRRMSTKGRLALIIANTEQLIDDPGMLDTVYAASELDDHVDRLSACVAKLARVVKLLSGD